MLEDGSVTGTLKYVTGFTQFSTAVPSEQEGNFFPFTLGTTGSKMTLKTNGVAKPRTTDMAFDKDIIFRVTDNSTTFTVEVDGAEVVTLNFANAKLAQKSI